MGWSQFGSLLGREFQESLYKSDKWESCHPV
jgi:hypothetical protein